MNINPHLQHLQGQSQQQQQNQQQQHSPSQSGQSPQISQMQMHQQRQLQQQRQQLINQHLHQQQQPHSAGNTLLATLNGGIEGGQKMANSGPNPLNYTQNGNPLMLIQQQMPQRFANQSQQQSQQQRHLPQQLPVQSQQQVPVIKEVWSYNLEYEFNNLRAFINDKTASIFISIHQEIPGIVARPVGTFKSSSDYHFQTLRLNSDLLNLIQLSFCVVQIKNNEISNSVIWQFNFHYDLAEQMFNEEHLSMLSLTSQINFASHAAQGVPHLAFAELMMESGLLLDSSINWLSYHSGYDLGFLVSLLTNDILPNDENEFFWWCSKFFPNFYDLKHIGNQLLLSGNKSSGASGASTNNDSGNGNGVSSSDMEKGMTSNNKPLVEYLAEELHLLPISPVIRQFFTSPSHGQFAGAHHTQQMTSTLHAYLLMECFKELFRQANSDVGVFGKYKGYLWGLGDVFEGVKALKDSNGKKPKPYW